MALIGRRDGAYGGVVVMVFSDIKACGTPREIASGEPPPHVDFRWKAGKWIQISSTYEDSTFADIHRTVLPADPHEK